MEPLHIFIHNEIGLGGITPDEIQNTLNSNPEAEEIIVHISSPGGEVFDGWTIGNIISQSGKKVTAIIEGLCASIATFIALKADEVQMTETGRFMIHNPTTGVQGDAKDMTNAKELLESITNDLVKLYKAKTGLDEKTIRSMMDAETFMTPEEARKAGFVDSIVDGVKAVAYLDKKHINMTPKNEEKATGIIKEIKAWLAKQSNSTPTNVTVELADGGNLFVESEDGDLTGKSVFTTDEEGAATDTPAPDGDHELVDGRVLVVSDGVVTEIREGSDETEALKQEIEDLKAQLEKANGKSEEEEEKDEVLESLITQVENLTKITVGGDFKIDKAHIPPGSAKGNKVHSKLGSWGKKLPMSKNFKPD